MAIFRHFMSVALFLFIAVPTANADQQMDLVREFGEAGKSGAQSLLHEPRALALFGDKMYIAETDEHKITVLDKTGKKALSWGEKGNKPGQLKSPSGISIDELGRVFVSDTDNNRIQVFDASGKFIRSFGEKGDGPRQFNGPAGSSIYRGMLYVADTGNKRVQILTVDGIFLNQLTVKTESDEMKAPLDVAVDVQNKIYVLDTDSNKVRIFDQTGNQVLAFGAKGSGKEGLDGPRGLAVDLFGCIYLSDTGNYKLKKFDARGRLLGVIGSKGDGRGQFREAAGMKVDKTGRIIILDAKKNTLQVFTSESGGAKPLAPASPLPYVSLEKEIKAEVSALATYKRVWGITGDSLRAIGVYSGRTLASRGSEPGFLKNPRGFTMDDQGYFWIADTENNRIQKLSRVGNLMLAVGKSGKGEGEFRSPSAIAVSPKGSFFVADTGNRRIQVFSASGVFRSAFGKEGKAAGQFSDPVDLTLDGSDNIYVVDRGNCRILKFDSNGKLLWETGKNGSLDGEFKGPENIVLSPDNELYVLDAGNTRVQVFTSNGKFLRKFGSAGGDPGQFKEPQGLALEGGLRLYVGDRGNGRVQAFSFKFTPAVPQELLAQSGANEVQVSWKPNSESYFERYNIYRSESLTGEFKLIASSAEPFYIDRNLPSNSSFNYTISSQAVDSGFESIPSTVVSATTPKLVPSTPKQVKIEVQEKQITLSWIPNTEPFIKSYNVYRSTQANGGFTLLKKMDKTILVDRPLEDETVYYYQLTAVGKEGDESPPTETYFLATPKASLSVPPLEIAKVDIEEIFAAAYKYYESHVIGNVILKNNTDTTFTGVKFSFHIKNFMDFPMEVQIPELQGLKELDIELKPVFNNKILEVTENTPLQSEFAITYYLAGEAKTITRSFPVMLYERNAIRWDQKAKVGSFITSKDTVVTDFTRAVIQQYVDAYPNMPQSIVYARSLFDALGVLGFSYILDPTPFQEFSENSTIVDYTAYPREILARKSGDCDGLSMMFAASMENIGIESALIDVPGHVFYMFNTGITIQDKATLGFPDELLIQHDGNVWIPIEMTVVGTSFTKAWQKGAEEYRDWTAKKKLEIINVHTAWETFKPVTLPPADFKPVKVAKADIEAKYKGELETLGRQRLAMLSEVYLEALKKNPADLSAMTQLGILYGENGLYAEALEQFQKMLAKDKDNAVALNNIGNVKYMQDSMDEARQAYESALKAAPGDVGIMVNLARVQHQAGKKTEAKQMFQDAAAIDPRVIRQYGDLAATLGVVK